MDMQLCGRGAVVTGASRGLGRAIALSLAGEGCEVFAVGRNAGNLEELAATSLKGSGQITPMIADLASIEAIGTLRPALSSADILVLNTGGPPAGAIADVSDELWLAQFESLFLSAVRLTRIALPGMRSRGYGRILPIVSSGVIQPIPNLGMSNAIRMAVTGWAKTLASEVAADGVTVNCLAPGRIATDRIGELDAIKARKDGISVDAVQDESRKSIPVGRYGLVEEFASVATFLASPMASYVTGGITRIDGGFIRSV